MSKKFYIIILLASFIISTNCFADEKYLFAIDLVRHGDRTPTYELPNAPYAWTEGLGELTAMGIHQEVEFGKELRKKYIEQYHLLNKDYDPNTLYVRSTDTKRTRQSGAALLSGLYPNTDIPISSVKSSNDNLLLVKPDGAISYIIKHYFIKRKAWQEKTDHIQNKLNHWSEMTGIAINNFQQLDKVADNLYIRKLHHLPFPKGLSNKDVDEIIALNDSSIIDEFKLKEVTHAMGQQFLKTVAKYFEQAIQQKTPLKYVLLLGHDSSIMSVMNTLHSPLDTMPPYVSILNFLLLKDNNQYYVKISYNNKPIFIPSCKSERCSIQQFIHFVKNN